MKSSRLQARRHECVQALEKNMYGVAVEFGCLLTAPTDTHRALQLDTSVVLLVY